ncbi:MAG: flagellar hook-length control protein FliK [Pseudomonadota bacterium]
MSATGSVEGLGGREVGLTDDAGRQAGLARPDLGGMGGARLSGAEGGGVFSKPASAQPLGIGNGPPQGMGAEARASAMTLDSMSLRRIGEQRLDVVLDPPELGRVEIVLDFRDDGLRATVTGERGSTLDLLRRHADQLLAQLLEAGFADASLSFSNQESKHSDGASALERMMQHNIEDPGAPSPREPSTARAVGPVGIDLTF